MYHTHTANWCFNNGNLWDLQPYYVQKCIECQVVIKFLVLFWTFVFVLYRMHNARAWYNGSTSASQAEDEGSIPFARTKNTADPCGRIYFWRCGVGREPDRVANGIERVRDEAQRSERGPWSENKHGNIHSLRPHQELNRPKGRFFYLRLT